MKNFIDSIIRLLIFLVIFLGILFIATVFYAYNSDPEETISISGVEPFIQSIKIILLMILAQVIKIQLIL